MLIFIIYDSKLSLYGVMDSLLDKKKINLKASL